jgi:S-adenosylmethionine:tRNA-ribosyltransferase-isomerase (queuine synthetase)
MKQKPFKSSVLVFAHYNEEEMKVKVQIKETREIYEYSNVPLEEYIKLIEAKSIGRFYNSVFKKNFPEYEKLA